MQESAPALRRKADRFVREGRYQEAADAYRKEAAIYRRRGDVNGAKVEEMKADRYTSGVRLFAHLPDYRPVGPRQTLAKYEPPYGCYLGVYLDRDDRLGRPFLANNQAHRSPTTFGERVGKKHASAFCYLNYGRRFPLEWARWLGRQGVAPHVAWEPNQGLGAVRDDEYLRSFARDAARAGVPVFLRFASEMNGAWTAYSGDPLRYKIAWATVYRVMADLAPNVVLVWCVNAIPEAPIESYYPGDAYVDWVGVNFYSVPFYDNDPSRPGLWDNPADQLRYVYGRFASRKPVMVCEFGASHRAKADGGVDRSPWAVKKINELYAALPRLYPRVKMVDIFDNDNLTYALPGRQLNDYSITDSEEVERGYARAIAPDYFLSDVITAFGEYRKPTPVVPLPPAGAAAPPVAPRGILRVSSWSRSYADRHSVTYLVDGAEAATAAEPGPREVELRLASAGLRRLGAVVRDDRGKVAARTEAVIRVS